MEEAEAREAERKRQAELENRRRELADGDELNRIYEEEKKKEKEAELEAIKQQTKFQHVRDAALKKEAEAAERRARMKVRGTS
ncbi:hypothetical protein NP493_465g02026 [Ridgeia piscesae]|uniref:Uncharacterized protein n=1 Tax=Ridgeia piscesae TaxID=27915 RepID=A0AAD9NTA9_RIDPI|nr:hypothetical protein NP493_465g02026 [Ridgeia piscesae]